MKKIVTTALVSLCLTIGMMGCGAGRGISSSAKYLKADSVDIWVQSGREVLPVYDVDGRSFLLGERGREYSVWVANKTDRRMEVVLSVDGTDVVSGQEADYRENRGYVLFPGEEIEVKGFRTSLDSVARFEFTSVDDSYASRMGDAGNVGVIGAAVFLEEDKWEGGALRMKNEKESKRRGMEAPAAAPSAAYGEDAEMADDGPGIGTGFGDQVGSQAEVVPFKRASDRPDEVAALYYDDRSGLEERGVVFEEEDKGELCDGPNPFPGVECKDDGQQPLRQL